MSSKRQIGPSDKGPRVITEQDRRAAYVREAPYRPHWPKTFEAADADPSLRRILEAFARSVPTFARRRADRPRVLRAPELEAVPDCEAPAPGFTPARQYRPPLDQKRLASGERPDDE